MYPQVASTINNFMIGTGHDDSGLQLLEIEGIGWKPGSARRKHSLTYLQSNEICCPAFFGTFVRELDSSHAQTDDVIKASTSLQLSSSPLTIELVRKWNPERKFFESADATFIPFDFKRACDAISKLLRERYHENYSDNIEDPANTVAGTCRANFSEKLGESGLLVMHSAVHETVWYVLRPSSSDDGRAMVLETYTQLVPIGFDAVSETDKLFPKMLSKSDEDDVDDLTKDLRALLLDEDAKMTT
ncbi:unnamed protein product [Phytophthora lilii]|uniref:Unnamed protein product n=1 Tax=Phytophthora lilii TaxID=2077276 RepID=A0A9W6XA90_9STRA|nr:unnamed protein product [Phytophthora lilii]